MAVRMGFDGSVDEQASRDLEELAEKLAESGVAVERTTLSISGVKDVLTIGISIASLTVSSISTLIAVVNFWKNQRKTKYRLKLDTGAGLLALGGLDDSDLSNALKSEKSVSLIIEKI